MEFEAVMRGRFSARAFRPDPVSEHVLARILELAQCAPSWCNTQPWQLIITRGAGTERLRHALYAARSGVPAMCPTSFPLAYEGVYRERRKICGVQLYQSVGIGREDRDAAAEQSLENFRFFGAPHLAILPPRRSSACTEGCSTAKLYIQKSFMLAAVDSGVQCIAQAALAAYAPFVRACLDIPESRRVVCGISFGYADSAAPINTYRTHRTGIDQVVRFLDA
ncbi:MAG: nitroreductase family protein [Burkholderiales bacterium]|nr:nitroreductase family protein [Burkholderiales bacterium]